MTAVCRKYKISGRVQGVGFRAATLAEAERLQVTGWARNLASGEVEVLACGEREALVAFERWLRRGPRAARVSAVDARDAPIEMLSEFEIR